MHHGWTERTPALLALTLLSAPLLASSSLGASDDDPLPSPQVGEVAPSLGYVEWRQLPSGKPPKIEELRGKVVVVQTWVWFCDS